MGMYGNTNNRKPYRPPVVIYVSLSEDVDFRLAIKIGLFIQFVESATIVSPSYVIVTY